MSEEALRVAGRQLRGTAASVALASRRRLGVVAGGGLALGVACAMTSTLLYATALSPVMSHDSEAMMKGFADATGKQNNQARSDAAVPVRAVRLAL